MQKREWIISIWILCALALVSVGLTAFVLHQNEPENVEAFENRFLDLSQLGFFAPETMNLQVESQRLMVSWPSVSEELLLTSQVQPLPENAQKWRLTLGAGGAQNGMQKERWNYQVWLELQMLSNAEVVAAERAELPLLSENPDRTRIYTVCADASAADSWQLRVIITPIEGTVEEGLLILNNCEVASK